MTAFPSITFLRVLPCFIARPFRGVGVVSEEPHLRLACGCVLTSFGRVGTVGMERGYSWSFVPFQAVCVHTEFPGNRATDPNRK